MICASGTLFDGESLRATPVTIEFTPHEMVVRADTFARTLPLGSVHVSEWLGDVPRFIYLPNGGVIESPDNGPIDAALRQRRHAGGARLIHFLEQRVAIATGACVILVLIISGLLYYGPTALARTVAQRAPREIEVQAGRVALATLNQYFRASTLTAAEQRRVQSQMQRLLPNRSAADRPRIEFRSASGQPNAIALPGQTIVVTDELVRLDVRDDEIAAVLAHEIGHLENRHGLQSMLRSSLAVLVVTAITGDVSTLTSFAGAIPLALLTSGYARDLEREADAYACDLLRARRIPTSAFNSVLGKLEASHPQPRAAFAYLNTHPATDERIKLFGAAPRPAPAPAPPKTEAAVTSLSVPQPPLIDTSALSSGDAQPTPIHQVNPVFPVSLRLLNRPGEVVVDFVVTPEGNVANAHAIRSTDPAFEPAAVEAVSQWKFKPRRKKFRPVSTHMQVPIVFALDQPALPAKAGATAPRR